MIENIIKCTVREEQSTWDKSLDFVMMAYCTTPQTSYRVHTQYVGACGLLFYLCWGTSKFDGRWIFQKQCNVSVIYWHKPTAMQTLSSGWTDAYVLIEKLSVFDYKIQLNPTGYSKVVHVDQLILDPCHQDRANWVKDNLACQIDETVIDVSTDLIVSQQTKVGVSIACQTSDTDPIVVSNDKVDPTIIVRRSSRQKRKPHHLIYYLQI